MKNFARMKAARGGDQPAVSPTTPAAGDGVHSFIPHAPADVAVHARGFARDNPCSPLGSEGGLPFPFDDRAVGSGFRPNCAGKIDAGLLATPASCHRSSRPKRAELCSSLT